jgi:hypothetical protein
VFVNDPEIVNQLYSTMNKYYDKTGRGAKSFKEILGDSILIGRSTEMHALKRKHLS